MCPLKYTIYTTISIYTTIEKLLDIFEPFFIHDVINDISIIIASRKFHEKISRSKDPHLEIRRFHLLTRESQRFNEFLVKLW